MPFSRFHGLTGVIVKARGAAYEVSVKDGTRPRWSLHVPNTL